MAETTTHIYEMFILTKPEQLWDALTNGEQTSRYFQGLAVQDITTVGANYRYLTADGACLLDGKVLESNPLRKLVTTSNHGGELTRRSRRLTTRLFPRTAYVA